MASQKPIATYHGDTLRNLLKQASQDRMERDPKYRRGVHQIIADRKRRAKARKETQRAHTPAAATRTATK